eukprot:6756545-Prymnesium_polylepis.1
MSDARSHTSIQPDIVVLDDAHDVLVRLEELERDAASSIADGDHTWQARARVEDWAHPSGGRLCFDRRSFEPSSTGCKVQEQLTTFCEAFVVA